MEYHLERGLRLLTETKYEHIYKWAIVETDAEGRQVGGEQIPWRWSSSFTASSCELDDSTRIGSSPRMGETPPVSPEVKHRQVIRAQLRPVNQQGIHFRQSTFSMFGTGRVIKSFDLRVQPVEPDEQEHCSAWGTVSYTSEADVGRPALTEDDCVVFYLSVKSETFAWYADRVAHGLVDEIVLSVEFVDGFYSEWGSSLFDANVKVLTMSPDQAITLPPGHEVEPPRLGRVGKAELHFNRRLVFGKQAPEEDADLGIATQIPAMVGLPMLDSLRRAVWIVVCLLVLILGAMLLRR